MPRRHALAVVPTLTTLEDRTVPAGTVSELIVVDQIGWRADSPKVAVFTDPVNGQNSPASYTPGATFQVRRTGDDTVVFTGAVVQWGGGAVHGQSGDRAWHGDFSALTTPGEYYVYDPATDKRSFAFRVRGDVFNPVLKTAGRVFFYQRSGFDKLPQHAGPWSHAASHLQERTAQRIVGSTPQGPGTARDLSGGWWDAGDYNKYVPFTTGVLWDLLSAYEWNPAAFTDAWNVPASGNGTPDLLDEVRWELDWLLRMQLTDGSVINRVGQTSYDVGSGPTADTQPHYYTAATTWATASFAASTAHAARVFAPFDATYAATLRQAAERAWGYLTATPTMQPASGSDGGNLAAAAAGGNAGMDLRLRILASAELWRLTGTASYKTYFEANYRSTAARENGFHPILDNRFDPSVGTDLNRALVTYSLTPGATAAIVTESKTALKNHIDWIIRPEYAANDPYRGFMWDGHYTWGSNQLKANWANLLTYAIKLGVGTAAERTEYRAIAEEYLHYFHGRNPMAMTYLTNAGSLGADRSPMEAYHGWWPDGSALYDGANSTYGPAPGYVVGGSNQFFGVSWVAPPFGEPPMKAYKDWNTGWNPTRQANENSWEINEPAIYYQAAYLLLVSQYATTSAAVESVSVNGGAAQRSRVTEITVTFDADVDPGALATAFTLTRTAGVATVGTIAVATQVVAGRTVATLTFSGASTDFGSLSDGRWTLTVDPAKVVRAGAAMAADFGHQLHRLYGDVNGDAAVNGFDYSRFRTAYGATVGSVAYRADLDFNGDGAINGFDYSRFRTRYGVVLP
ncbi:MAG TPA: glycoside hydrolase family 9 protein [Fimbriiglobus sp.]|nr:glycoside hydrolase family 9 protein [Fimbriiglobus sp.]